MDQEQNPQASPPPISEEERQKAISEFMQKNASSADDAVPFPNPTIQKPMTEEESMPPTTSIELGHVLSETQEEKKPAIINAISSLFFVITFTFSTLSLLLFAVLVALTIALANAGSPGFMYLRYYPKVGLLPVFAAAAAMVFFYVAYKLREGSRQAWVMAVVALATLPTTFSFSMPVMSYPLVRLVSVYAGSPEKPLITPGITVTTLAQIFSVFMAFDLLLIALLVTIRYFKHQPHPLSNNAKTSLAVLFMLFFVPTSAVAAYGYWDAGKADFGYAQASNAVSYRVYFTQTIPGGRVLATRYQNGEELANKFNATKVVYDAPLPTIMQTGKNSPIILKQVEVPQDFSVEKFVNSQERDAGTNVEAVQLPNTMTDAGYLVRRGTHISLYALMPDLVFVEASSDTATADELAHLVGTLE